MRKLGQGQSVVFIAPDDVLSLIMATAGCTANEVTSKQVLLWATKETRKQIRENALGYVIQGYNFVRREAAWNEFADGTITHGELAKRLCEPEARSVLDLYGPSANEELSWIREYHSPQATNRTSQSIYQICQKYGVHPIADTNLYEEKEIELSHEKEVERVLERPPPAKPEKHYLHPDLKLFVTTGIVPRLSQAFLKVEAALENTSVRLPPGLQSAMANVFVTKDFTRTIQIPNLSSDSAMDDFIRAVEWLVVPNTSCPSFLVIFSPFEVNHLYETIKNSHNVRLYLYASQSTLSMKTFQNLGPVVPCRRSSYLALPPHLLRQVDLFAGSIFLKDYQTYKEVCKHIRVQFDAPHSGQTTENPLALDESADSTTSTLSVERQAHLRMNRNSFVSFLRRLLTLRLHGREIALSHMDRLLKGEDLREDDFDEASTE
jgi:hypothetical protein